MNYVLPLSLGLTVFALILAIGAYISRSTVDEKLERVSTIAVNKSFLERLLDSLGKAISKIPLIKELVDLNQIERYLRWTGWSITPAGYIGISTSVTLILCTITVVLAISTGISYYFLFLAIAVGQWIPWMILRDKYKESRKKLDRDFIHFIERVGVGASAKLPILKVLEWSGSSASPVMAQEVGKLLEEVAGGSKLGDAFDRFAERIDSQLANEFVVAIKHAQHHGGSYEDVLMQIIADRRQDRAIHMDRVAGETEVKMILPIVLTVFPATFLFVIGPLAIAFIDQMVR